MTTRQSTLTADWESFILSHGWRAAASDLAKVLGRTEKEILKVRHSGAVTRTAKALGFAELFALWHGRQPREDEWPAPKKHRDGGYEWLAPEVALLATLVGTLGVKEITQVLNQRLAKITGDRKAKRTQTSVQVRINLIGLQSSDVVGGITTKQAAEEIGSFAIINQNIDKKQLRVVRVGRRWVIPHAEWAAWKAKRVFPPKGYVQLSSIREDLAIRSDKLSEFARMGYVPTAIRCNPYGVRGPSTQFGTWYIAPEVAKKLLADRRAGRPMPWHGKPMQDNLKATFRLWQKRMHPVGCATCAQIWGKEGAPKTFESYQDRYPPLAHGAKRHLTMTWTPGMTIKEVAEFSGQKESRVRVAINNGMLASTKHGRTMYVTRTDATRWKARKCPAGDGESSWISMDTAASQYFFSKAELKRFIAAGQLNSKIGTNGAQRGIQYVSRHQCGQLREKIGFTEEQAAARVGVTVERLRILLAGVNWRSADKIPLATVQAAIKRLQSREGYTLEEAAEKLGMPLQWVIERKNDGTIRVSQARWDRRRIYITEPMMQRLIKAKKEPRKASLGDEWLFLSEASAEAGVCSTTLIKWAEEGLVPRRKHNERWRYHREAIRAQARKYWKTIRFHRATPPAWMQAESESSTRTRAANH